MQEETEEMKDMIHRLLEHVGYWEAWPQVGVYNEDGIVFGQVTDELQNILSALSEYVEE